MQKRGIQAQILCWLASHAGLLAPSFISEKPVTSRLLLPEDKSHSTKWYVTQFDLTNCKRAACFGTKFTPPSARYARFQQHPTPCPRNSLRRCGVVCSYDTTWGIICCLYSSPSIPIEPCAPRSFACLWVRTWADLSKHEHWLLPFLV